MMTTEYRVRVATRVVAVASVIALIVAIGATGTAASPSSSWAFPNGNLANTRVATGSSITTKNVANLKEVWSFKLKGDAAKSVTGYGALAATPIVVNGVVYIQDLHCNVYALSLANGTLLWEYAVNKPEKSGPGPNGVAVAGGVVYGMTPTVAFALDATNGHVLWLDKKVLKKGEGTFGIQPQVANGRMYIASQYGSGPGGGVLLALSARTGHVLWRFNTLLHTSLGVTSLGVGAGGAWETPLVGTDGSVTYGIGNPYQSLGSAIAYPAKLLYTDSEVNLNAATGKLRWYYQAVPNDFKDYDLQTSPIATTIDGRAAVIGGGKMGIVYAMNASNGALLWKTPVGEHNGHDNDSSKLLKHSITLKVPFDYAPGSYGGILTNMAASNNSVYLATVDLALAFTNDDQVDGVAPNKVVAYGEVEALNLTTGKVEWDTKVPQIPLGATTVVNNLVFTTLIHGELLALNRTTGAIVDRLTIPTSTNSPIAVAGNTIIVPAGGLGKSSKSGLAQVVAYRIG